MSLYTKLKEQCPEVIEKLDEILGGSTSIRIEEVYKSVKKSAEKGTHRGQMIMSFLVIVYNKGYNEGMDNARKIMNGSKR